MQTELSFYMTSMNIELTFKWGFIGFSPISSDEKGKKLFCTYLHKCR